jgi:RNase P protein component
VVVTTEGSNETPGRQQVAFEGVPASRLGITVGRKAGPSVKRNLFKRRVREWFRQHRDELPKPLDIVVIARRPGVDLNLVELGIRLSGLLGLESSEPIEKSQDSHLI